MGDATTHDGKSSLEQRVLTAVDLELPFAVESSLQSESIWFTEEIAGVFVIVLYHSHEAIQNSGQCTILGYWHGPSPSPPPPHPCW